MKAIFLSLTSLLFITMLPVKAQNDILIKPLPQNRQQTIEGWGSSLCWWAHMVGQWEDEAKIDSIVKLITSPEYLNMNIFRYNIGGGDNPQHYSTPGNPGHMASGKGVRAELQGFWPSQEGPYDWTSDSGQRKIMLKIKANRSDAVFEAFSNSPPYWMTYSGCSAGNDPSDTDNLKPAYYEMFCDYLINVCKFYKDSYGIEFKTLEPFNESLSAYWGYLGSQEGCHFDLNSQIELLKVLAPKLESSDLNTVISASDETNIHDFILAMNGYIKVGNIMEHIGQINTHTYSGTDDQRIEAQTISKLINKPFWQSETGPGRGGRSSFESNLGLAQKMFKDLQLMQPVAWLDWQMVEESNETWCQIRGNFENETFDIVKNLYVRMQVTRFIKQGYVIINSGNSNVLTAISPESNELVMVVINNTSAIQDFFFDLSDFKNYGDEAKIFRTSTSENCMELSNINSAGSQFSYESPSRSITTLILPVQI